MRDPLPERGAVVGGVLEVAVRAHLTRVLRRGGGELRVQVQRHEPVLHADRVQVVEDARLERRQRDLAYELLTAIPGVTCVRPQAALYMFPRLDPEMYPIKDDRQFLLQLLEATRVMLVQGTGFNWPHPDHFRIVFLPHEPDLREAIGRIAKFLEEYRRKHAKA